jgi:hypothetical protein
MTPIDFLRAVWPTKGYYCLATPFKIPNTDRTVFAHKVFSSLEDAANYADQNKSKYDMFFAVHTLKEEKVWNPEKYNYKTDSMGAFETRKHSNMLGAKCFFFDLDVETNNPKKYSSQAEAATDLKRFCEETKLPRPLVTSSGGGLHVYWLLDDFVAAQPWKDYAIKLRQLARHHSIKFDPARTTDVSSVLRVVGTFNLKRPTEPRPVRSLTPIKSSPNDQFLKLLDDAVTRAGITVTAAPAFVDDLGLGSNLTEEFSGPPTTMKAVVSACAQMQYLVKQRGNVSEPEWYHSINLVRFLENGDKLVHKISEGHSSYSYDATEAKVAQLRAKNIKPTSCSKLAEVCGEERCEGCIFAGKVKSPIVAARWKDPAPTPVVEQTLGPITVTTTIPEPPKPYTRMKDGKIAVIAKNKDGDEVPTIVYDHDLYPIRRIVNSASELEQQMWRAVLPRSGQKDFVLDADALYDKRKFVAAIANQGIYPRANNISALQEYMIAYITELQRLSDAEAQCNHLGWTDDKTKFIMPDKILLQDGTAKPATLSLGAQRSSAQVHKKGSMQRQIELLEFYNHDAYIPNQFFILCGLAAPMFYATGHHGVVVNATGEPGASKSTTLYTAASLWGQPELYPINGTNNGATMRGRNERVTTLANLPICVDEITHMPIKDAIDLAMSITQPGHRIRLNTEGIERSATGSYKATIMLTTANASLHSMLSTDNAAGTAGSMRVFEIQFKKGLVHAKSQADDFIHELMQNYGHIGEQLLVHAMQHQKEVEDQIRAEMRQLDTECAIQPSERFWSSPSAVALVIGRLANKLGLLKYPVEKIKDWLVNKQIPYMRGVVVDEYTTPITALADYLEHINNNTLIVSKTTAFGSTSITPVKVPHGELLARFELEEKLMWVSVKGFKDWCVKHGLNHRKVLEDLSVPRADENNNMQKIILSSTSKKVLGAGTELAKAQSRVILINMAHKDISGAVDLNVVADNTTKLRAV